MTTQSGYWTTDAATPVGDQVAEYNQAAEKIGNAILAGCSNFEGVAPGFLNALEGTVTGSETVQINTGGAVVDGLWFYCSAAESVTIPSATAGNTRIDRIVLRADWANFNVSIHRIAGTDSGSPTAPAITQTAGTTYDIMLYQALVDPGGTVTLTDERVWARVPVDDTTISFFSGTLRVKDVGITAAKIATNAVETAKIKDSNVTAAKLANNAVETAKIKDGQVTNNKIADGTITETKLNTTTKIFDPPAAGMETSYNQDIPNNSWTLIDASFKIYEKGNIATNFTNKKITINVDGLYLVTGKLAFLGNSTGIRGISIYINGNSTANVVSACGNSDGDNLNISHVMFLQATDYLHLYAYQNSGGVLSLTGSGGRTQLTATYLRS